MNSMCGPPHDDPTPPPPAARPPPLDPLHQRANLAMILGICGVIPLVNLAAIALGAWAVRQAPRGLSGQPVRSAGTIAIAGGAIGLLVDAALLVAMVV
jgi:hypothetical protein